MFESLGPLELLIIFFIAATVYFIPSILAIARQHHNKMAIIVLNFFLGWTFLGWIGALVWSLTNPSPTVPSVTMIQKETESKAPDAGSPAPDSR